MFDLDKSSPRKAGNDGYIVIVVLLLTAVLLMLGLSMAARTTEQVYLSSQEADSTRVFNAAESGLEEALYQLDTGAVSTDNISALEDNVDLSDFNNSNVAVTGVQLDVVPNITIEQGKSLTLKYTPAGNPDLFWVQSACGADSVGLLVTLYTSEGGGRAYHQTYSSSSQSIKCQNSLAQQASELPDDKNKVTLRIADFGSGIDATKALFYRVTPLYHDISLLDLTNSGAVKIVSTATDTIEGAGAASNEVRKIQVIRTEPAPPSIFDYAVFSGGNLVKQ